MVRHPYDAIYIVDVNFGSGIIFHSKHVRQLSISEKKNDVISILINIQKIKSTGIIVRCNTEIN